MDRAIGRRPVDPDRPATMKAQVDETALDYRRAALARRRLGKAARASVDAEIRRRAAEFAHMPREAVEKAIDLCPPLPERPLSGNAYWIPAARSSARAASNSARKAGFSISLTKSTVPSAWPATMSRR